MYRSKETMKLLLELIDFWLPDFKYFDNHALKNIPKYPTISTQLLGIIKWPTMKAVAK